MDEYSGNHIIVIIYISEYELLKYSYKKNKLPGEFIENINIVYPDKNSASGSAEIFRILRNSGNLINENDILIAGISLQDNNKFITLDSDFNKINNSNIIVLKI